MVNWVDVGATLNTWQLWSWLWLNTSTQAGLSEEEQPRSPASPLSRVPGWWMLWLGCHLHYYHSPFPTWGMELNIQCTWVQKALPLKQDVKIKALHELSVSVCTDAIPTTSKAFHTCHRGQFHDLGNECEMCEFLETTEPNWKWLELWKCVIFLIWVAQCKLLNLRPFNKRNERPQPKLLDDKVDYFQILG